MAKCQSSSSIIGKHTFIAHKKMRVEKCFSFFIFMDGGEQMLV